MRLTARRRPSLALGFGWVDGLMGCCLESMTGIKFPLLEWCCYGIGNPLAASSASVQYDAKRRDGRGSLKDLRSKVRKYELLYYYSYDIQFPQSYIYTYKHIHTHTHTHIYIYMYI